MCNSFWLWSMWLPFEGTREQSSSKVSLLLNPLSSDDVTRSLNGDWTDSITVATKCPNTVEEGVAKIKRRT